MFTKRLIGGEHERERNKQEKILNVQLVRRMGE